MRRLVRIVVGLGAVTFVAVALVQSSGAQIPPTPSLPSFTTPTFPPRPTLPPFTTTPPPTMPPSTTTPPPTMPPSTTTPPPTMPPSTMPPPTISSPNVDALIENIIDQLEQHGDEFADIIQELRELESRF